VTYKGKYQFDGLLANNLTLPPSQTLTYKIFHH